MRSSQAFRSVAVFPVVALLLAFQPWLGAPGPASATPDSSPVTTTGDTTPGGTLMVNAAFSVPGAGAGNYLLDTEVYSAAGAKVAQWFDTTWVPTAGTTVRYSWSTVGLPAGSYRFAQGVFGPNWAGSYSWESNAGSVLLAYPAAVDWSANAKVNANVSGTNPVHIQANFQAASGFTGNVMLDTEIYGPSGNKVAQWAEPAQMNPGQTVAKSYDWSVGTAAPGTYSVRQGIFAADWSHMFTWRSDGVTFSVPAPAPVATVPPAPTTTTTTRPAPAPTTTTTRPAPTPTTTVPTNSTPISAPTTANNPFAGGLWVNPGNPAAAQAGQWRSSRPADAALMDRIAAQPVATWLGGWTWDVQGTVNSQVSAAAAQGKIATFVAYNIPGRDCGQYSAGGALGSDAYRSWIRSVATGIGNGKAAVVLEPDALSQIDCMQPAGQADRLALLNDAVNVLSAHSGVSVYLDAGHPGWHDATTMAQRLSAAGVARARGFSLNVSNFDSTADNTAYGESISNLLGGSHFVVDTSRSGNGSNGDWCNPVGRALGATPTIATGSAHADAFLWIKQPGESDGNCNGGPSAGVWWADYALGLAVRAWN